MLMTLRRVRLFAGFALASFAVAGCRAAAPIASAAGPHASASATLQRMYDEYFEERLALYPTEATYIGDDRYDDRLENPADPGHEARRIEMQRRYLARARAVNPDALSPGERISYDIFVTERELELDGSRFPDRLLPVDQMSSLALTFARFGSGAGAQPFRTVRDYERFLARGRGFVAWVDSAIAAMREGAARGVVQPRIVVAKLLPQLRALAQGDPEKTVFWQAIEAMPESIGARDRTRLRAAYREAIAREWVPAYARLADFVEREYLPRARESVAWSALPNGQAWYAHRIRERTTTTMSPDEIHELGLAEVARIRAEMLGVMREVGFEGDLRAFFEHVQRDDRFYFATAEELIAGYRALQQRIDALLPKLFVEFPKANYVVREVEPFRAASAAGASYQAPSADGRRPGIFYVNTYDLRAQPIFGMETLSLHEASPGHHFQIALQQERTDLPRFQRFGGYTVYAEGWALYAESLGKELGLFTDPMQYYGRLSDEMLRAMRLVVDTGLHAKGWTRERAIQYMRENSSMAESDVVAEVERYLAWPAQALAYKVGQLRMTALRELAARELGSRFDVRAFHREMLRDGSLPINVLEAKMKRWIEAEKRK